MAILQTNSGSLFGHADDCLPTLLLSGFYQLDSFRDAVNVFFLFKKVGVILF
jgi:hypothetical protein